MAGLIKNNNKNLNFKIEHSKPKMIDLRKKILNFAVENKKKIPINTIMDRFSSVISEDIQSLVNKSKNSNTTKATSQWMRVFNSWTALRGDVRPIYLLCLLDLDKVLQRFYAEVRKTNGDEYEPNSLASMQAGIDGYLKENNYHVSFIRGGVFSTSTVVLEEKCENLREHGKGKRANKSYSLSESEINILWECEQLGTQSPMSLINTIWWLFTLHFGLRGRQEYHSLAVSDIHFKKDDFDNEFVMFIEGITKTRQSGLHEKHRLIQLKMFSTDTSRCPVNIFKLYLSKRPSQLRSSGPLYLSIIHKPVSNSLWYKNVPMGQYTINSIMKRTI